MDIHAVTPTEQSEMQLVAQYNPMRRYVFIAKRENEQPQIWATFDLRKAQRIARYARY